MAYRKPTGALLKRVRPDTYRQVVELLAEPREHVSYREIERICRVGGDTIKAVERAEAEAIQDLKQKLMKQSLRVAKRALNRIEDGIDTASVAVAVPVFGVAVEKALLLAGDATHRVEVVIGDASHLYSQMALFKARLEGNAPVVDAEFQSLPASAPVPPLQAACRDQGTI